MKEEKVTYQVEYAEHSCHSGVVSVQGITFDDEHYNDSQHNFWLDVIYELGHDELLEEYIAEHPKIFGEWKFGEEDNEEADEKAYTRQHAILNDLPESQLKEIAEYVISDDYAIIWNENKTIKKRE